MLRNTGADCCAMRVEDTRPLEGVSDVDQWGDRHRHVDNWDEFAGVARPGMAWLGRVRHGKVRRGAEMQGTRTNLLVAMFGVVWHSWARRGQARCSEAGLG